MIGRVKVRLPLPGRLGLYHSFVEPALEFCGRIRCQWDNSRCSGGYSPEGITIYGICSSSECGPQTWMGRWTSSKTVVQSRMRRLYRIINHEKIRTPTKWSKLSTFETTLTNFEDFKQSIPIAELQRGTGNLAKRLRSFNNLPSVFGRSKTYTVLDLHVMKCSKCTCVTANYASIFSSFSAKDWNEMKD